MSILVHHRAAQFAWVYPLSDEQVSIAKYTLRDHNEAENLATWSWHLGKHWVSLDIATYAVHDKTGALESGLAGGVCDSRPKV